MTHYFDHNATTPLSPPAREAWLAAQADFWQNPSSLYRGAGAVKRRLEDAREAFGEIFGCEAERIIFNSGATEGCNRVLAHEARQAAPHARICLSAVEHSCVGSAAPKSFGATGVSKLPVDSSGRLDLGEALRVIEASRPTLVSVMAANNETGVLQPWRELAEFCRSEGLRFHCDAAQWLGKMPPEGLAGCDWVTVSAHKFGGPKGVGLVIIPADVTRPLALQAGGAQESGHRGGTEDFPGIAAMLAALETRIVDGDARGRDGFESALMAAVPGARLLGAKSPRLANTSMAVMPRHGNLKWLTRLDERGFAVSTGSACSAGRGNPSHTLAAMGLDPDEMGQVLRFSSGPATTSDEWLALAAALEDCWKALQGGNRSTTKVSLSKL